MRNLLRWVVLVSSVLVAGYGLYAYAVLSPGQTVAPEMRTVFQAHLVGILTHVFCSVVAIAIGPLQFLPSIRKQGALHHRIGYVYFASVIVGGIAGFRMAFLSTGGFANRMGFGLLGAAWVYSALRALWEIRQRDFVQHEVWAVRSFGLTFAAVTLRIYMGLFFAAGMPFREFYPVMGWLCWVPNVLWVEWFFLLGRSRAPVRPATGIRNQPAAAAYEPFVCPPI
jgi:hypothetical protein